MQRDKSLSQIEQAFQQQPLKSQQNTTSQKQLSQLNKQKFLNGSGSLTPKLEPQTSIPLVNPNLRQSQQHKQLNNAQQHVIVASGGTGNGSQVNQQQDNNLNQLRNILSNDGQMSKSDRGGLINKNTLISQTNINKSNFDQTYFGDSFQIQKESLRNLDHENDYDLLRDSMPTTKFEDANGPFEGSLEINPGNENYQQMDQSLNISPINATSNMRATNKIENLNFEVQLKSLVFRIKNCTNQIKEKVKVQRELSESFIQDQYDEDNEKEAPTELLLKPNNFEISIGKQENGLDVSAIVSKHNANEDKSIFVADTSIILQQTNEYLQPDADFGKADASFLMAASPKAQKLDNPSLQNKIAENKDQSKPDVLPIEDDQQQISLQLFEKIVRDLQSKHRAERDMLTSEITIFKKVIHLMGAKIRYLQDEIMDKDKLERDLFKVTHLNMKLENQYKKMREENRKLNEKIEVMRRVMFEYDMQMLEEQTNENYMVEQLIKENHQLQRLLLIAESGGLQDYTSLEDQIRQLENQTVNILLDQDQPSDLLSKKGNTLSYFNKKKQKKAEQQNYIPEPLNQSMPNEVKKTILERQMIKEDERRINLEMRRIAEEEIMRELKMAEEYYIQNEFQKTNKNFPIYKDSDLNEMKDDEIEDGSHAQLPQNEHQQQVSADDNNANTFQKPPPSSPTQELQDTSNTGFDSNQNLEEESQPGNLNQTALHYSQVNDDDEEQNTFQYNADSQQQLQNTDEQEYDQKQQEHVVNIFKNGSSYIDEDDDEITDDHEYIKDGKNGSDTSKSTSNTLVDDSVVHNTQQNYQENDAQNAYKQQQIIDNHVDQDVERDSSRVGNEQS